MSAHNPNPARQYWSGGQLRRLPPLHSRVPRRVDVRHDPRDFLCCLLGGLGFSSDCIAFHTGLSVGQINYRLSKGYVSRRDYRNGNSVFARQILSLAPQRVVPMLNRAFDAIPTLNPPPPA